MLPAVESQVLSSIEKRGQGRVSDLELNHTLGGPGVPYESSRRFRAVSSGSRYTLLKTISRKSFKVGQGDIEAPKDNASIIRSRSQYWAINSVCIFSTMAHLSTHSSRLKSPCLWTY